MRALDVRCPDISSVQATDDRTATLDLVDAFGSRLREDGVHRSFGLELKAAFYFEHLFPPAPQKHPQSMRKFFLRPAVEPIIYSYCHDLDPEDAQHPLVDRLVSSTAGALLGVRGVEARSGKDDDGNYVVFPDQVHASTYLQRLRSNVKKLKNPVDKAAYVFAESILSHPYMDGNARLGRCLSLLTLAKHTGHECLPIALGPILMANNDMYIDALQSLSENQDWVQFFDKYDYFLFTATKISLELM